MPAVTDDAICIGHWDWSETSQTVHLFCRAHGTLRAVAKGSRREGSRFSGGVEILTRAEILVIIKPGDHLSTLTEWNLTETFPAVRSRLGAFRCAMAMIETVRRLLHDGDPHPPLFDSLLEALRRLEPSAAEADAILAFLWSALCECGYRLDFERDMAAAGPLAPSAIYGFDPALGGLIADPGAAPARRGTGPVWRVRSETVEALRALARGEAPPADAATGALRFIASYVREVAGVPMPALVEAAGLAPHPPPAKGTLK